jgi:hypothetical protein
VTVEYPFPPVGIVWRGEWQNSPRLFLFWIATFKEVLELSFRIFLIYDPVHSSVAEREDLAILTKPPPERSLTN